MLCQHVQAQSLPPRGEWLASRTLALDIDIQGHSCPCSDPGLLRTARSRHVQHAVKYCGTYQPRFQELSHGTKTWGLLAPAWCRGVALPGTCLGSLQHGVSEECI